jgi:hypothetical protein
MDTTTSVPASAGKRKDPPFSLEAPPEEAAKPAATKVTPVAQDSPYETRIKELKTLVEGAGDDFVLWDILPDVLPDCLIERIPGKLDELGVEEADELTDDQVKQAHQSLTAEQVDQYLAPLSD